MSSKTLIFVSDGADWALDRVASEQAQMSHGKVSTFWKSFANPMARVRHFLSPDLALKFLKFRPAPFDGFVGIDFFHGLPEDGSKYVNRMSELQSVSPRIGKIRVTNRRMRKILAKYLPDVETVVIPIAVAIEDYEIWDTVKKEAFRRAHGIRPNSTLIGSFQKDGVGWKDGLEPKFEKGPDLFVETLQELRVRGRNPHALLSGPSRQYLMNRLADASIPFTYLGVQESSLLSASYSALDLYLVTSRLEGGPRALLESLASGIPVVSTDVGQAGEVLQEGKFSAISQSFDAVSLSDSVDQVLAVFEPNSDPSAARKHAGQFSLENTSTLWNEFFPYFR